MNKTDLELESLDSLIKEHSATIVPEDFSKRVMKHIEIQPLLVRLWERPWVQWAAASIGLAFAMARLLNYIFSAWLAIELAG